MVFVIGKGNVIKGWDQGLIGMCVGEIRKLIVPSDLAYGDTGKGMGMDIGIPERATLVFEVELLNIEDPDYFIKKRGVPL
jgi:FKBP-type peptidyl-prolyl cis-trans isomerase